MNRAARATLMLVSGLGIAGAAAAGEMKDELDCVARDRLLETHFGRYGHSPAKTIVREAKGTLRFRLPAAKDVSQTGLYSYVVLSGDFEVAAHYEWVDAAPPQGGYGVSSGVAIDVGIGRGLMMVALTRSQLPEKGKEQGYVITVGKPAGTEMQYETTYYYSKARRGRLVVRREKDELICLTADGAKEPLEERLRIPSFPMGKVHQVRFFADTGGSPTALEARLGQLRLAAEEISGGFPKREQPASVPSWLIVALAFFLVIVALVVVRRRQQGSWLWQARDDY
jgi:hypothetical protein